MAVVLVAKFAGDVTQLTRAYDEAHRIIMDRGGAPGELRHHCAVGDDTLWLIGVWESEELLRARFASAEFEELLVSAGFPSPKSAEMTVLKLHAIEPPLTATTQTKDRPRNPSRTDAKGVERAK